MLYFGYLLLGIFIVYFTRKKYEKIMSWKWMSAALLLRIIIGIAYGYLYSHAINNKPDTWRFFQEAVEQAPIFKENPLSFFTYDIVDHHIYSKHLITDIFKQDQSLLNDMHETLFVRFVNFLNILSGEHYYVNVILFNIITIWGSIHFTNWFLKYYSKGRFVYIFFFFLFPSFLYWNCGVHRDGLSFLLLATLLISTQKIVVEKWKSSNILAIIWISIQLLLLFIFKIYWVLILIPFLILFLYIQKKQISRPFLYFSIFTIIGVVFFALSQYAPSAIQLTEKLAEKQHRFLDIPGTILLKINALDGSILSYLKAIPDAFRNIFFTPAWKNWFSVVGIFALFGQVSFWMMLIFAIIFHQIEWKTFFQKSYFCFILFFLICNYILIGITIPYLSALIRYIINFQTLFMILLGLIIDWQRIFALRIFKFFNINKFAKN